MKRFFIVAILLASTAVAQAQNYRETWDDVQKPCGRIQRWTRTCKPTFRFATGEVGEQLWGRVSPAYRKCMARHHWKLNHVVRLHHPQQPPDDSGSEPVEAEVPSPPSLPDVTPVPPIVLDPVPSPDIHPFCADTIC
jgi:hypothetical protein